MEPQPAVDFRKLADLVKRHRKHQGLSLRRAAEESRVSSSTLSRIERCEAKPDLDTVRLLVDWVGVSLESVAGRQVRRKKKRKVEQMASTLTNVEVHLRADPNLDEETAEALVDILKAAYSRFAKDKG